MPGRWPCPSEQGHWESAFLAGKVVPEQHDGDTGARELATLYLGLVNSGPIMVPADAAQVPYLKDANKHDFGHSINSLTFGADLTPEQERSQYKQEIAFRRQLGILDPLTKTSAHVAECMSTPPRCGLS